MRLVGDLPLTWHREQQIIFWLRSETMAGLSKWSHDTDEALKLAVAGGVSVQRMAVRFRRSSGEIERRLQLLGLEVPKIQRLLSAERSNALRKF